MIAKIQTCGMRNNVFFTVRNISHSAYHRVIINWRTSASQMAKRTIGPNQNVNRTPQETRTPMLVLVSCPCARTHTNFPIFARCRYAYRADIVRSLSHAHSCLLSCAPNRLLFNPASTQSSTSAFPRNLARGTLSACMWNFSLLCSRSLGRI